MLIAIIKMMQNVVECCCECSKKETEKHIVHTVNLFLTVVGLVGLKVYVDDLLAVCLTVSG